MKMKNWVVIPVIIILTTAFAFAGKANADRSLILYLTFDDGKGDTAKDQSQYGNHGTLVGGPKWVNGKFNGALEFDGEDDYIVVKKSNSLRFGKESFTVEVWVNLSKEKLTGTPGGRLANNRGTGQGGTLHGWQIKLINEGAGGKWGFMDSGIDDATGNYQVHNPGFKVTTAPYKNGEWYHVGVVYKEATSLSFYVNGELDGEVKIAEYGSLDNDLPVAIGAAIAHNGVEGAQLSQFFPGMVDDVRIWSRALSQAELRANMTGFTVEPIGRLTTTWGNLKSPRI